jgi:hypothetical protein
VKKQSKYHLDIRIDKLTNSILNTISGDSFSTDVHPVTRTDLKAVNKKNGWLFSWTTEFKFTGRQVYKLTIRDNPNVIQGLASMTDNKDHYYIHLVESAPFNLGRKKLYEGVPGNLFAFACKNSWDNGYQGFVSFNSKTKLIEHYMTSLGATHVGGHQMVIFPSEAIKLIKRYYPA